MECEHIFVRTEIVQERDYDRIVREPIYYCLRCGLTNGYVVKDVNPLLLSKTENDMAYIFEKTAKNGILLHERRTCPLDVAKVIYEEIQKRTKNLVLFYCHFYITHHIKPSLSNEFQTATVVYFYSINETIKLIIVHVNT